jgi:(5-formylfuran-3-yl)methyl phosphate synthase
MRLLVSVVDAAEARVAAASGADIIDVKDPSLGALGEAAPAVVRAVRDVTPPHLPVSAALGDGPFAPASAAALAREAAASGAAFVKLGLAHTALADAAVSLRAARAALPAGVRLVVAGFADFVRAGSPGPAELPALAAAVGAEGCLLDTAVKDGRGLFHWLDEAALRQFVQACRERGLLSALAGSLRVEDVGRLGPIGPDLVGVRGAACVGDRVGGRVDGDRVRALVNARALAVSGGPSPASLARDRAAAP